jgi:hypothetical protein
MFGAPLFTLKVKVFWANAAIIDVKREGIGDSAGSGFCHLAKRLTYRRIDVGSVLAA